MRPEFRKVRLQEGYDIAEVDQFVDRVLATLAGAPTPYPVTADEIRAVAFTPRRFRTGYEVAEVDYFLDAARKQLGG